MSHLGRRRIITITRVTTITNPRTRGIPKTVIRSTSPQEPEEKEETDYTSNDGTGDHTSISRVLANRVDECSGRSRSTVSGYAQRRLLDWDDGFGTERDDCGVDCRAAGDCKRDDTLGDLSLTR
jgi:hypothetical protein